MKYLKYGLFLILLLGILFFVKGIITPSIQYECEVVVNKSLNEAWAVMSDEAKLPEWITGFKKTELVSGIPNTIGAVSKIYVEEGGQEMTMQETITNIKPNELMAMTFTMDFMNMDYEMILNEKNGSTTIKSKSKTTGNGIFAKSMVSFMRSSMKSQEEINLNKLKNTIEQNTKNYFLESFENTSGEMIK